MNLYNYLGVPSFTFLGNVPIITVKNGGDILVGVRKRIFGRSGQGTQTAYDSRILAMFFWLRRLLRGIKSKIEKADKSVESAGANYLVEAAMGDEFHPALSLDPDLLAKAKSPEEKRAYFTMLARARDEAHERDLSKKIISQDALVQK